MIIKCADFIPVFHLHDLNLIPNRSGNPAGKKRKYVNLTTAFDIETSYIPDINQSVMYIWQWQLGEDLTVIGRTWEEFIDLQKQIRLVLPDDSWLVVYDHNLSFEFQFLKGVYAFTEDDVFATASRKILKCDMWGCFEFRCSYLLTNLSLASFTEKMNVKHKKLSGEEFNYHEIRYPWTELTERQMEYCVNDVQGLVEAVNILMDRDSDTLQTIPLTSTGYVRRNAKRSMRGKVEHDLVSWIFPDYETFKALREAFRGGNTHANRYFVGDIIENVHSRDRSSSYPAVMCNCEFPMTPFIKIHESDLNSGYIARCMTIRHKALLLRIGIKNLKLRNPFWGCPYISIDKCRNLIKVTNTEDNGRVLCADYVELTVTDIDLKIIMQEYSGEIIFFDGWYSTYRKLPQALIDDVIKYYKDKTELKGVEGQELYYDKAKALLNSLYGMMAQNPVKHTLLFRQCGDFDEDNIPDEELLAKSSRKAFLAYQWGVWVCAWSRYALEEGIRLVHETPGAEFIYCDTDSVKYTGDVDWSKYNGERLAECLESGSFAADPAGREHYMGVFESEDGRTGYAYRYFKTLGAKKYAYVPEEGSGTRVTVSGVNKKLGGPELDKYGGLSAFEQGFVFREASGTMAVYSDDPEIKEVEIDGHQLRITSNVSILPSEYTLGLTGEYERIIIFCKNYLENPYVI